MLVAGNDLKEVVDMDAVRADITKSLRAKEARLSEIVKILSKKHHLAKNIIYDEALKIKGK